MGEFVTIKYDDTDARGFVAKIRERAGDWTPVWVSLHAHMSDVTARMFEVLGHGGTYRGVTWKPFAPQYRRKTDGVVVPAHGGVRRIRSGKSTRTDKGRRMRHGVAQDRITRRFTGGRKTSGTIRGKLRPSGKRVTTQSKLMQDTGRMRNQVTQNRRITKYRLVMKVSKGYAAAQHRMRPFLFITETDMTHGVKLVEAHIVGEHLVKGAPVGSMLEQIRRLAA